jgi:hypothetical protein
MAGSLRLTSVEDACGMHVGCMWDACGMHVGCMWLLFHWLGPSEVCMWFRAVELVLCGLGWWG